MAISREEFDLFRGYIKEQCGIVLEYGKEYLIESRLTVLMVQNGCTNLKELYYKIISDRGELRNKVIDLITINETLWFRDDSFFEVLSNRVVPWLIERARTKKVRIWSAACSTGQEPYSVAMMIDKTLGSKVDSGRQLQKNFEILATDISSSAIFMAVAGRYSQLAISRGMREEYLIRYFKKDGGVYELDKGICSMVRFKHLNLKDNFSQIGLFDLIFCRNVLIYFSDDLKRQIYHKLYNALLPDGILALGASESAKGYTNDFEQFMIGKAILYRPVRDRQSVLEKGFREEGSIL